MLEGLGWVTHWFYLPLALAVPTPQMLVHAELNFLYQFLIHTELLGDLGPLGRVLNTASHHRVHHGANRYCLDKNYGQAFVPSLFSMRIILQVIRRLAVCVG